jgi:2-keto-3-deoxy-L-rhamnonate aldolase RhmA
MSWLAAHLGIEEAPGADDLDSAIDRAARRVVAALKSSDVAREVVYEVIRRSS